MVYDVDVVFIYKRLGGQVMHAKNLKSDTNHIARRGRIGKCGDGEAYAELPLKVYSFQVLVI